MTKLKLVLIFSVTLFCFGASSARPPIYDDYRRYFIEARPDTDIKISFVTSHQVDSCNSYGVTGGVKKISQDGSHYLADLRVISTRRYCPGPQRATRQLYSPHYELHVEAGTQGFYIFVPAGFELMHH